MNSPAVTEMESKGTDTLGGASQGVTTPARAPRRARRWMLAVLAVLAVLLARPAVHHARATSLLLSFSDPAAKPDVTDERITFSSGGENVPARVYRPAGGAAGLPGVVLVHGVHRKGIDEPRLERFARAVAATGVVVMTPAVKELSDYKVAPRSVDTVGAAVETLKERLGTSKVGLMGMSFGGGISLLAAADPRFASEVGFVVAVGAHDDLGRVSRFFVNDELPEPGGSIRKLHAHGYGMMVLVYSHIEDFFAPADVPAARDAIRLYLWEERAEAKKVLEGGSLSPEGRAKLESLFDTTTPELRQEMLAEIGQHGPDMAAVSPHGHLGALRANVYLLHGEADTVIPSTETLWLAEDVPSARLRSVLVSPAIEHVELKSPTLGDRLALVRFMGQVMGEVEATR